LDKGAGAQSPHQQQHAFMIASAKKKQSGDFSLFHVKKLSSRRAISGEYSRFGIFD